MTTRDVAHDAYKAAEAFLETLGELEEIEAETGEQQDWPPTAGAYCGCGVCDLREGLFAAWPVLLSGVTDLLRDHGHRAAANLVETELTVKGYGTIAA